MENTELQEIAEIKEQLRVVNAYQHFLYYIEPQHIKDNDPWEESGLLPHFMEKLIYYQKGEMYLSTRCVAEWFQNMNKSYQADLLRYIMKFHADQY